jgi:hypothetical protein
MRGRSFRRPSARWSLGAFPYRSIDMQCREGIDRVFEGMRSLRYRRQNPLRKIRGGSPGGCTDGTGHRNCFSEILLQVAAGRPVETVGRPGRELGSPGGSEQGVTPVYASGQSLPSVGGSTRPYRPGFFSHTASLPEYLL